MRLQDIITSASVTPLQVVGSLDIEISFLTLDSRRSSSSSLFVAQRGETVDGHTFIGSAIGGGCQAIVCQQLPEDTPTGVTFVVVSDTHQALGRLASAFYGHPSRLLKLVGVTGTNGKTTIATLLYRLTKALGYKSGLFSTVANYVDDEKTTAMQTTPDSITLQREMRRMVDAGCQYCFMEVSSHSVVQGRIAGLDFDGGVFTNLTHDHLDYHKTFDAYIDAKKGFFDNLKPEAFAITNADDKNGQRMLQNTRARKITYSLRTLADYKTTVVEDTIDGMLLNINHSEAYMQFVGHFNAYNLTAIYASALSLGFESHEVLTALSSLKPVEGRFQTTKISNGATAIVDYAHTPDALLNVLETINEIRREDQRLICVAGCGGNRDKTKRPEMARIAVRNANQVILTSDNPRDEKPLDILSDMKAGLSDEELRIVLTIEDRREAIRTAVALAQSNDIILVAGKGHEDYQEIRGVKHHFSDLEELEKFAK